MVREFQFYIVPTPIGNIQDITLRAIDILKSVDIIACEDTRTTQKLLNHYEIRTKCISYHKYNEKERVDFILRELNSGKTIALVSDAGTPLICDPGSVIIKALTENNITFTALPGACAITTFMSHVSREDETFSFVGFMPRTQKQIEELCNKYISHNMVFYESPERISDTLKNIMKIRGDIKVSLGRELSKLYEEVNTGKISEILNHYNDGVKGEIICMLYAEDDNQDINVDLKIKALKNKGYKDKDISIILSTLYNINKNEVYQKSLKL